MHEPVTFRSSSSPATATGDLVWPNPATMFPLPTPGMYSPGSRPQGSGRESGRDQAGSGAALEILTPKMFTYGSCMIALDTTYLPRLLGVVPLEQEIASLAEIGQVALEIMFGCVEDDSAPDAQSGFHEEGGRGGWTLAGRSEALMVGVWGIPNVHRTPTPD
ncbi:hypothetical protein MMC11_008025 [Xylographa trunciseda]|nr:hypothetical protein [Xylographa trunciseda]